MLDGVLSLPCRKQVEDRKLSRGKSSSILAISAPTFYEYEILNALRVPFQERSKGLIG